MKMATARMTMIGLYNYDPTLFDSAEFPEGINKKLAVETILLRCGESPAVFQSAPFMKMKISNTARKWYNNIEHMLSAIDAEYNPIYNYDRFEEWHDDDKKNESTAKSNSLKTTTETESDETNKIESDRSSTTIDNATRTTQNDVSAFNSSEYQPSDKTTETGATGTDFDDETTTESTNKQTGSGETNTTGSESHTYLTDNDSDHTGHMYGNIGVTTSQQMLESEFKLRQNINIYDVIAEIFFKECCIYVY